jgi:methane/phenol/toluene hydroxylase
VTTQGQVTGRPEFDGFRNFIWFTPERRKPTEYENYTVGQQSSPEQWLDVDWPLRYDDGSPPWDDSSSAVKLTKWFDYRDPNKTWQRPYVSQANEDEQALARLLPVLTKGSARGIDPTWASEILGTTYAAWPFVEYGLFLALAYAVREARADTVEFATVFQAGDRMRVLQDIVLHLDHLTHEIEGFSDAGAREAWMSDPTLTPIREIVEHLAASRDWVEIILVSQLVFEPLLGQLAKSELFSGCAGVSGDTQSAIVLAQSSASQARGVAVATSLVKLVVEDETSGAANADVIANWVGKWKPMCEAAARAFLPRFTVAGADGEAALGRALANCEAALSGAGLKA